MVVRGGPRRIAAFGDSDGAEPVVPGAPSGSYNQRVTARADGAAGSAAQRVISVLIM